MADLTNLPDKVCRAVWYYLIQSGVLTRANAFHHFDARERDYSTGPITTVTALPIGPEVQFTGNDEFRIQIVTAYNAATQPQDLSEAARLAFSAQVGAVRQKLMLSEDGETIIATRDLINTAAAKMANAAQNGQTDAARFAVVNADMADFTLLKIVPDTYGVVRMADVNWTIGQAFRVTACESAITGYF